jgi:hypothetical protein
MKILKRLLKSFTVPFNVSIHLGVMSMLADNFVFIEDMEEPEILNTINRNVVDSIKKKYKGGGEYFCSHEKRGIAYIKAQGTSVDLNMEGIKEIKPFFNGISVVYKNGVSLSTAFGYGTYSANYDAHRRIKDIAEFEQKWESPDCEIAIFYKGKFITPIIFKGNSDDVVGYVPLWRWCAVVEFLRKIKDPESFIQDNERENGFLHLDRNDWGHNAIVDSTTQE